MDSRISQAQNHAPVSVSGQNVGSLPPPDTCRSGVIPSASIACFVSCTRAVQIQREGRISSCAGSRRRAHLLGAAAQQDSVWASSAASFSMLWERISAVNVTSSVTRWWLRRLDPAYVDSSPGQSGLCASLQSPFDAVTMAFTPFSGAMPAWLLTVKVTERPPLRGLCRQRRRCRLWRHNDQI